MSITAAAPTARPRRIHRSTRRLAGALATAGVVAGLAIGGAGTASATPADGQPYWAVDGCHYSLVGGAWTGDLCATHQLDAQGEVVPSILDITTFDPTTSTHIGQTVLQFDVSDTNYLNYRDLTKPLFTTVHWARQQVGVPGAPVQLLVDDGAGGTVWVNASTDTAPSQAAPGGAGGNTVTFSASDREDMWNTLLSEDNSVHLTGNPALDGPLIRLATQLPATWVDDCLGDIDTGVCAY